MKTAMEIVRRMRKMRSKRRRDSYGMIKGWKMRSKRRRRDSYGMIKGWKMRSIGGG